MKIIMLVTLTAGIALAAPVAEARITRIEITSVESPTFKDPVTGVARTFGDVGAYEKLRGKAYGEVDPRDPQNAVITDIELAPRNTRGNVEYSMDIYVLKPVNLRQGNRKLFMEVNNRGGKLFGSFNRSGGGNNPTSAADAGDAFLMHQGYSLAWNGWDISAAPGADRLTITVPTAKNPDGTTITGPSYEYIVFDNATTETSALAYPAASLNKSGASLTVRNHLMDPPTPILATGWEYTSTAGTAIRLLPAGTKFKQSAIYEFSYVAKDPVVAGLGLAATRDFISFLKHARADDLGNANPLAHHARKVYTFTVSQPARYLNDFQALGFNADERGRRAIDGILNWIGAGTGVAINFRFAQTARTERNRQNHLYPEAPFPFAYPKLRDHLTGKVGGRGVACAGENHDRDDDDDERDDGRDTCPKALEVNSANEYWVKTGSLLHTDTRGRDLEDPKNVRFYLLSSVEHTGAGSPPNSAGSCQQFRNTTDPNPALRALFVALDQWVTKAVKPPKSEVPTRATGVFSTPVGNGVGVISQAALGWPSIPGVTYSGVITVRHLFNFGPRFDQGILDVNPPDFSGPVYPSFVSKVDADGNDVAGVRLPPVAAPIATTSGWGLRSAVFGGGPSGGNMDGCESSGQWIAFKARQAERMAAGDPRKSLEERYGNHEGYVKAVAEAARKLQQRRLLLEEDVQRYIDAAQASTVLQ
jgi:hypothetical protein